MISSCPCLSCEMESLQFPSLSSELFLKDVLSTPWLSLDHRPYYDDIEATSRLYPGHTLATSWPHSLSSFSPHLDHIMYTASSWIHSCHILLTPLSSRPHPGHTIATSWVYPDHLLDIWWSPTVHIMTTPTSWLYSDNTMAIFTGYILATST